VAVIEFGPRLIPREDQDVSNAVAAFLKQEGIDVRLDSKMVGVEKQGNLIAAKVESAGRILVDRDDKRILGVLDIMYAKAPYTVIQRAMHIHPTVSEFIPTMLDKLKPLQ
jgi:hypothetical protein